MAYIQQQQQQQQAQAGGGVANADQTEVHQMSGSYQMVTDPKINHHSAVGITISPRGDETTNSIQNNNTHHHQLQQQPQTSTPTTRAAQQQQQQQQHNHPDSNGIDSEHDNTRNDTQSTSIVEDESLNNNNTDSSDGAIKTPNSYKYPLLKKYYEFGPWIGRNRKATCLGCRLQTSSSQPDRLLKHLNKCNALNEEDKVGVRDLMNERTANKRKKPMSLKLNKNNNNKDQDNDSEYYGDDQNTGDELTNSNNTIPIPSGGLKKLRRDHPDKNSQIDEALTRFIMMCRIPLKSIHSQEFVEFVRALNPDYHIPSRETITNVLIPGLLNII